MGTLIEMLHTAENKSILIKRLVIALIDNYGLESNKHLGIEKVVGELKQEKVLDVRGRLMKQSTKYKQYIEEDISNEVDIKRLTKKLIKIFAGKKGVAGGRRYILLSTPAETTRALVKFIADNDDVTEEDIVKATKLFFDMQDGENNIYKYAPKIHTFITGNESKAYLLNYVMQIKGEDGESNRKVKHFSEGIYRDV